MIDDVQRFVAAQAYIGASRDVDSLHRRPKAGRVDARLIVNPVVDHLHPVCVLNRQRGELARPAATKPVPPHRDVREPSRGQGVQNHRSRAAGRIGVPVLRELTVEDADIAGIGARGPRDHAGIRVPGKGASLDPQPARVQRKEAGVFRPARRLLRRTMPVEMQAS